MEEHRLNVKIPEVQGDDTTAWATAAPDLAAAESAVPGIGTEVWIEFESGDPNYPIWGRFWPAIRVRPFIAQQAASYAGGRCPAP